jgi:hypothetical protein
MTTFAEARDEIFTMFQDALSASAYWPITVRYPNLNQDNVTSQPDSRDGAIPPFIIAEVTHYGGRQTTVGGPTKRFERTGAFRAQIYTPRATGLVDSDGIAKVVVDAFEGQKSPSGIWFRNVRMDEIGPDGIWFRVDVIADFRYDEIK